MTGWHSPWRRCSPSRFSRQGPDAVHRTSVIGHSVDGRAIDLVESGTPGRLRILVVGCIHGNECAGMPLRRARAPAAAGTSTSGSSRTPNPDGRAAATRQNAHGVDLNRNFPRAGAAGRGDTYYSGAAPASEPETRAARALIDGCRPKVTIWFHQHMRLVWTSEERARRPPVRDDGWAPACTPPLARRRGVGVDPHPLPPPAGLRGRAGGGTALARRRPPARGRRACDGRRLKRMGHRFPRLDPSPPGRVLACPPWPSRSPSPQRHCTPAGTSSSPEPGIPRAPAPRRPDRRRGFAPVAALTWRVEWAAVPTSAHRRPRSWRISRSWPQRTGATTSRSSTRSRAAPRPCSSWSSPSPRRQRRRPRSRWPAWRSSPSASCSSGASTWEAAGRRRRWPSASRPASPRTR